MKLIFLHKPQSIYKAEIIDTWNMTITLCDETFIIGEKEGYRIPDRDNKKIILPGTPYLAIRLKRVGM
jgi:hypothetical protein